MALISLHLYTDQYSRSCIHIRNEGSEVKNTSPDFAGYSCGVINHSVLALRAAPRDNTIPRRVCPDDVIQNDYDVITRVCSTKILCLSAISNYGYACWWTGSCEHSS